MLFEERSRAQSFGAIAELYDRARPSYPAELLERLLADAPRRVLDVGCGTGIAGALLASRGCEVLGVEIDPRMAAVARRRGLALEVAPFEQWEPGGRTFDLAICAQAWHWIEPRAGTAKLVQVLPPGAQLALFWNFGEPPPALSDGLAEIYERLEPQLASYSALLGNQRWRVEHARLAVSESGRFTAPQVREFGWRRRFTRSEWLELLETHSDHQTLAPARRRALLDAIGALIEELGGSFELGYVTALVEARRRDDYSVRQVSSSE